MERFAVSATYGNLITSLSCQASVGIGVQVPPALYTRTQCYARLLRSRMSVNLRAEEPNWASSPRASPRASPI